MSLRGLVLLGLGAVAGLLLKMCGRRLVDGLMQATTSRPSGPLGRALYRDATSLHGQAWLLAHERLALRSDDRLLDVGCGGGTFLTQALETVATAAGLDHSPDMIELARVNNAGAVAEGRLDLRAGDAAALPWDDDSFDVVTNLAAFNAMPQPELALQEAARVLEPGGRFLVVTMAMPEGDGLESRFMRWLMPWARLYRDDELADLLARAGFLEIQTRTTDDGWQIGYAVTPQQED